jgi:hypothetical protein
MAAAATETLSTTASTLPTAPAVVAGNTGAAFEKLMVNFPEIAADILLPWVNASATAPRRRARRFAALLTAP